MTTTDPTEEHPFWEGAARGVLRIQHCADCGHATLLARGTCPSCLTESLAWVDTDPVGVVESTTRIDRPPSASVSAGYGLAVVRLDAGPCILTRTTEELPAIGQRVRIGFSAASANGRHLPVAHA